MSAFCAVLIWERFSQQDESRSSVVFFFSIQDSSLYHDAEWVMLCVAEDLFVCVEKSLVNSYGAKLDK